MHVPSVHRILIPMGCALFGWPSGWVQFSEHVLSAYFVSEFQFDSFEFRVKLCHSSFYLKLLKVWVRDSRRQNESIFLQFRFYFSLLHVLLYLSSKSLKRIIECVKTQNLKPKPRKLDSQFLKAPRNEYTV